MNNASSSKNENAHASPTANALWLVLMVAIGFAWVVGLVGGGAVWPFLYPDEKDPQLLMSRTRISGLIIGLLLYLPFHHQLRHPNASNSIVAVSLAGAIGFLSSLAGILWAIWLRTD